MKAPVRANHGGSPSTEVAAVSKIGRGGYTTPIRDRYCASCQRQHHWVRAAQVRPLSGVGDHHSQCSPDLAGRALKQNRRAAEEARPVDGMGKLISARISNWPNSNHSSLVLRFATWRLPRETLRTPRVAIAS